MTPNVAKVGANGVFVTVHRGNGRRGVRGGNWALIPRYALVFALVFVFIFPFLAMLSTAFKDASEILKKTRFANTEKGGFLSGLCH